MSRLRVNEPWNGCALPTEMTHTDHPGGSLNAGILVNNWGLYEMADMLADDNF